MTQPTISPVAGHPDRQRILAILCLCLILVVVNVSSLNVALPSIITGLEPSSSEILWIVDSYALVFAGLLLPAGAIGDRFGRKGALLTGLAIFTACAIWASFSETPFALIAARGVMGIGAALMMPATLSIITAVFPPDERAKAIAIWSGLAGAGGAIGIISAGVLLKSFDWTSVFFVNVPIALLTIVLVSLWVPTSRDNEQLPLDFVGSVLSIGGLATLLFAIIEGPERGWGSGLVVGSFVVAAALLLAFVVWELRARYPMLDPRLFLVKQFGFSSLTITLAFLSMFGMFLLLAQYFQFVNGLSALETGVRMLPFTIVMIILAPRSPAIVEKIGVRKTVTLGLAVQAAGFAVMATATPGSSYLILLVAFALTAAGMAMLMPPMTTAIVTSLPEHKAGVGSAVNDTTREVGGAIGIAVMGTLLTIGYGSSIGDATDGLPAEAAHAAEDSIGGALAVASSLDGPAAGALVESASSAFTDGMAISFVFAAVLAAATAVLVNFRYPDEVDAPVEEVTEGV